jgi:hypothetical protein
VNIYSQDSEGDWRAFFVFPSREKADEQSSDDRIACIEIDCLEGDGL